MKKIVIFGSGNHAKVLFYEIFSLNKYKIIGFIDDYESKNKIVLNYKKTNYFNLGELKNLKIKKVHAVIGVGDNYIRNKIFKEVNKSKIDIVWETIISKKSTINSNVEIGEGTVVLSGSLINVNTKIGSHCIVNNSSSVNHDNILNNFASVGPGVITGGNCEIGKYSHLGIGSTIIHNVKVGSNTVIGGHSFVLKDCNKNSLYFGNPAKKIKSRKFGTKYL